MSSAKSVSSTPRELRAVSVSPARLAHVVFRTNQLHTMVDWYMNVLQARIAFRDETISFLAYDDEHHRIAIIGAKPYTEKPMGVHVGFYHVAFSYETLGDLLGTYLRLKDIDINPYRVICHGPTLSFYFRDPDENEVELQVDAFDTPQEGEVWMGQEEFASNPIGIEVDAEELVQRYRSGESDKSLTRRADRQD